MKPLLTLTPALLQKLSPAQRNVLGLIRRQGYCSRSAIGDYFGWGAPSVSKALKPLINNRLLVSESLADSAGERRRAYLTLNPELFHAVGVDLGFSRFSLALVNLGGTIVARSPAFSTLGCGPEKILALIHEQIDGFRQTHPDRNIAGTGVAFAGIAVSDNDLTRNFPEAPPWEHVPLGDWLRHRSPGLVEIQNDTIAGLLGELRYGHALRRRDVLYLYMVEGISLGLLSNGRIHHGHSRNSGEFGHICVIPDGPFCHCGSTGCLESVASSWAILKQMRDLIRGGVNIKLDVPADGTELNLALISRAAQEGVPLARNLMSKAGELIGGLLAMTANIFDPEKVILAGILSQPEAHPTLIGQIQESFQKGLYVSRPTPIGLQTSRLGLDGNLIGAAALVFEKLLPSCPAQLDAQDLGTAPQGDD